MTGIFLLRGSGIYEVLQIAVVAGRPLPLTPHRRNLLSAVRGCAAALNQSADLSALLDHALISLDSYLQVKHSMILILDRAGKRLYTVASHGYRQSGVGSEIALGCGVIGVAAEQRVPIRISYMTAEYSYSRAMRDSVEREGMGGKLETAIPLPGLEESRSQMAVPIDFGAEILGVLYVESSQDMRFNHDDEDALVALAAQLGTAVHALQQSSETNEPGPAATRTDHKVSGATATVRHYGADDSIFIDDDYLIKGVAGAIFWKLLRDYSRDKRTDFSNRELRLGSSLGLPDITDNLEARLILLQRRLSERRAPNVSKKPGAAASDWRSIVRSP